MTPYQRNLVAALVIIDIVILCGLCIIAFSFINEQNQVANPTQATIQVSQATLTPLRAPASTDTPSPTNTRVLQARQTAVPRVRPIIPAYDVDQGWKLYAVDEDGYAIGLPPSWQQTDVDPASIQNLIDRFKASNPSYANIFSAEVSRLATTGVKFLGFDLDPQSLASNFVTNMNILHEPLTLAVNLDTYVKLSVAQLEKLPNVQKPIAQRRVSLIAGDAQELKYSLKITQPNGATFSTGTTQYLVVRGKDAFVITLTTSAAQAKNYATTFEKIGKSFRWLSR